MIQIIGIMIGFYIVTRMVSLGTRKGEHAESSATRILAILTLLVAILGMAGLVTGGEQLASITRSLRP